MLFTEYEWIIFRYFGTLYESLKISSFHKIQNTALSPLWTGLLFLIRKHIRTILTVFFFILSSVIIVYLLHVKAKFMYEYQKGSSGNMTILQRRLAFRCTNPQAELSRNRFCSAWLSAIFVYNGIYPINGYRSLGEDFTVSWVEYPSQHSGPFTGIVTGMINVFLVNRQLEIRIPDLPDFTYPWYLPERIIDLAPLEVNGHVTFTEIALVKGNVEWRMPPSLNPISYTLKKNAGSYRYDISPSANNSIPKNIKLPVHKYDAFFQQFEIQ